MRLGISGAQGTGKSTLFHALAESGILSDHKWFPSPIQDLAKQYGLKLNESGNDLSQIMIMDHLALTVAMESKLVSDRTPLDSAVYSSILFAKKQIASMVFLRILKVLEYSQPLFDLCFYLTTEFPIEPRENRSPDPQFQQLFHEYAEELARDYGFRLVYLSGSVEERLEKATWFIEEALHESISRLAKENS